jgi:fucose 4-O-acetylase-like acetyltransferase
LFLTASLAEAVVVSRQNSLPMESLDFVATTLPLGAVVFGLCCRWQLRASFAMVAAKISLAIYLLHPLVFKHIQFVRGRSGNPLIDAVILTVIAIIVPAVCGVLYSRFYAAICSYLPRLNRSRHD